MRFRVGISLRNTTSTPHTVTAGMLGVHAGNTKVVGPMRVVIDAVVERASVGVAPCPDCPGAVTPTVVARTVPVMMPRAARRSLVSLGVGVFGRIGDRAARKMLGTASCVVEVQ